MGRRRTRLELWEEHFKDPIIASVEVLGESLLELASGSKRLVEVTCIAMACSCVGTKILQKMWEGPFCEGVWPCVDPWDSVRLRTACTYWNVAGKYGPHGELFFFLVKKEPVASNELPSNPFVSADTLKACALIGLHLLAAEGEAGSGGRQPPDFGSARAR